jgi:hypothetical protein
MQDFGKLGYVLGIFSMEEEKTHFITGFNRKGFKGSINKLAKVFGMYLIFLGGILTVSLPFYLL